MIGLGSDKNWSPPPQPKRAMPIWRQHISKRGLPIKGSHSWLGMARKWSILDQKLAKHGRPVIVPKWSKKIQKGPKWSLMVPNDQKHLGWNPEYSFKTNIHIFIIQNIHSKKWLFFLKKSWIFIYKDIYLFKNKPYRHRSSKSTFGATNIVIYTQERRINDFIYVSVISEDFIQKRHP